MPSTQRQQDDTWDKEKGLKETPYQLMQTPELSQQEGTRRPTVELAGKLLRITRSRKQHDRCWPPIVWKMVCATGLSQHNPYPNRVHFVANYTLLLSAAVLVTLVQI